MTTKEKLIGLFEENKGKYLSGEEIAGRLCVSRAAVWKAVKNLQSEGYAIDAVTNRGYCLSERTDILSSQGIYKYLDEECGRPDIEVVSTVDSTNAAVIEKAGRGAGEGCVVIANEQTKGRGRYGRDFFSPCGSGLYLSILLRPVAYSANQAVGITTMAAVAVCEAIEEIAGEKAGIKWVNDIYVRNRKVSGILTEASVSLENGMLDYAVLGVGVNMYAPEKGFPKDLRTIAGAVFEETQPDVKNRMAAAFLNHFLSYYRSRDKKAYVEKYRNYSLVLGKQIDVVSGEEVRSAYACAIDDDCHLLVRYEDDREETLSSGEIRIRL